MEGKNKQKQNKQNVSYQRVMIVLLFDVEPICAKLSAGPEAVQVQPIHTTHDK